MLTTSGHRLWTRFFRIGRQTKFCQILHSRPDKCCPVVWGFGSFHLWAVRYPSCSGMRDSGTPFACLEMQVIFNMCYDRKENAAMKTVEYTITDALGIHARPAGMLVKEAAKFTSSIKIAGPKKEVDAKRIMGVMSLGVKQNDTVRLTIEGADEEAAAAALEQFLKDNL